MKRNLRIAAISSIIILAAILFMLSPIFHIREVIVENAIFLSPDEVRMRLDLERGSSLILFNAAAARRRAMENFYISDIQFRRDMPNRLYVSIEERRLTAYIEHLPGVFLFIDDYGRVLEVRNYVTEPLPMLEGLQITRFQVGEILDVPDTVAFNVVVHYAQLLRQHGLIDRVASMNVSDTSNIRILVNYLEFNVGGASGADEKIRAVISILENLPNADLVRGFVSMTQVGTYYFLEILR